MGEVRSMPTGDELMVIFHDNLKQMPEEWQGIRPAAGRTESELQICAILGALARAQEQFEENKVVEMAEQVSASLYVSHNAA